MTVVGFALDDGRDSPSLLPRSLSLLITSLPRPFLEKKTTTTTETRGSSSKSRRKDRGSERTAAVLAKVPSSSSCIGKRGKVHTLYAHTLYIHARTVQSLEGGSPPPPPPSSSPLPPLF